MKDMTLTNKLLLVMVIPLVFYLLKILSFIFIPLVASMFIALLFLPLMRRLKRKNVSNSVSIIIVVAIIILFFFGAIELIKLSSKEIIANKGAFLVQATTKLDAILLSLKEDYGVTNATDEHYVSNLLKSMGSASGMASILGGVGSALTSMLMIIFFVVLWLAESINVEKVLNDTFLRPRHSSVKTFRRIEKDLVKFIKVKVAMSLFTGIGTGLFCYAFDVSFPIFWGLFAFLINFVQMVGSFIAVIMVTLFAMVEMDSTNTMFLFFLAVSSVQVMFGSILEPIFMGKSFSINIITVLVMLMLWGFLWGIPGMIMCIPITVFLKIIFEQFPSTKIVSDIMSGKD
jgi:predicted PurR-regulated permease PerM